MAKAKTKSSSRRDFLRLATTAVIATQADVALAAPPARTGAAAHRDAELVALGRQLETAWAAERAALKASDAEFEAAYAAAGAVVDAIVPLSARSLDGLAVKARAFLWARGQPAFLPGEAETTDFQVLVGLIADLQAIAAAGA